MDVEREETFSTDTRSQAIGNSSIGTNSVSNLTNNDYHDTNVFDSDIESLKYASSNSSNPLLALQLKRSKVVVQVIKPSDCNSLEFQREADSGSTSSLTPACRMTFNERNREEVKSDELAFVDQNFNTIHTDIKPDCASVSKQFCRNHLERSSPFDGSQRHGKDELLDGKKPDGRFACATCGKQFMANFTLRRHVKLAHKQTVLPEVQMGRKPKHVSPDLLACTACDKGFVNRRALNYHTKRYHHFPPPRRQMRRKVTLLEFSSIADFYAWKRKEEDATLSRFVKAFGDRRGGRQKALCSTYYCHRSGRYVTKGKQVRHMKKQGSCKIGMWCPAAMFVKISNSGSVVVRYCPDHENHANEITHLTLRKDQRKQIAAKLAANMSYDDILNSINAEDGSGNSSGSRPLHFVSKKDLHNITREFGVKKGVSVIDNVDSIYNWTETAPDNPAATDIAVVDMAMLSVRNIIVNNPALAKVAIEHLNKLESCLKLKAEPQVAQLPLAAPLQEPCNDIAPTRLSFESTRRPIQQRTLSMPTCQETRLIFCAEPLVSHQQLLEHDYSKAPITQTGVPGDDFTTQTGISGEVFMLTESPYYPNR